MTDAVTWLQEWYSVQCDGDWEHGYGIHIDTLDKPGWMVKIDLKGTRYFSLAHEEVRENYDTETSWMLCKLHEGAFQGIGGPQMLNRIIQTFQTWIEEFR